MTGVTLSIAEFAREVHSSRETVRARLISACVRSAGKRRGADVYRLRDMLVAWLATTNGEVDPERLPSFQRKARAEALLRELDYRQRCGTVLDAEDARREWGRVMQKIVWAFEVLPDRMERDAGATPAQLATVEKVIEEVREELADELSRRDGEPK